MRPFARMMTHRRNTGKALALPIQLALCAHGRYRGNRHGYDRSHATGDSLPEPTLPTRAAWRSGIEASVRS